MNMVHCIGSSSLLITMSCNPIGRRLLKTWMRGNNQWIDRIFWFTCFIINFLNWSMTSRK
jgi:hypothetical protein